MVEGHGDLHVIHGDDGSLRVVGARADARVFDTTFVKPPEELRLRYRGEGADFEFTLHDHDQHPRRERRPARTLVVSDLHGRLDALAALLKGNGVVDDDLNWTYGRGRLVVLGDMLDRGVDDNGVAWLVYKLEAEAASVGGRVEHLWGNHEDLVLKNDLRYVHKARLAFADSVAIPYNELYGTNTELGRWIRDGRMVLAIGADLLVHAGLSARLADEEYSTNEINELAARFGGVPNKVRNEVQPRAETLFGGDGPLWFRGMALDETRYNPLSHGELNEILRYYDTRRVIVGHSEVDEVGSRYDGRVITVNVSHTDNFTADRTAALLIVGGRMWSVTYSGVRKRL